MRLRVAVAAAIAGAFWGCAGPGPVLDPATKPFPVYRTVDTGQRQTVDYFYSVAPTCDNEGYPEVVVLTPPAHGAVSADKGSDYPAFDKNNVRFECNKVKVPSMQIHFLSSTGYRGPDSFIVRVRFSNSTMRLLDYHLTVQ